MTFPTSYRIATAAALTIAAAAAFTPLNRAIQYVLALTTLNVALWIGRQIAPGDNA